MQKSSEDSILWSSPCLFHGCLPDSWLIQGVEDYDYDKEGGGTWEPCAWLRDRRQYALLSGRQLPRSLAGCFTSSFWSCW